ncbi:MAG: DNA-3-methyladenine glycosylase [Acidaminococcaceae bacterium]|jgi:DNA-3-methyladenine glycosylase|nr:DNA-3-methyladenine glycosylase [Acidaminococcaceae bacterium]
MLPLKFYLRPATVVARELLGKLLVHKSPEGTTAGMIVETEAYEGAVDKACHAWHNRSPRTKIIYQRGGLAYVYLIYGMYNCFNVVAGPRDTADAVLIRALEPVQGIDLMQRRRGPRVDLRNFCRGPGKLCQALGITRAQYGADLRTSPLTIEPYLRFAAADIGVSPRRNIDYAEEARDFPWRFYLQDNIFVS